MSLPLLIFPTMQSYKFDFNYLILKFDVLHLFATDAAKLPIIDAQIVIFAFVNQFHIKSIHTRPWQFFVF